VKRERKGERNAYLRNIKTLCGASIFGRQIDAALLDVIDGHVRSKMFSSFDFSMRVHAHSMAQGDSLLKSKNNLANDQWASSQKAWRM
jgi:hypothetical protein